MSSYMGGGVRDTESGSSSPFDEALSRSLLGTSERTAGKKKTWTLFGSKQDTRISQSNALPTLSTSYRNHKDMDVSTNSVQTIEFLEMHGSSNDESTNHDNDYYNDEISTIVRHMNDSSERSQQHHRSNHSPVDLEFAILKERNSDINTIHSSISHLHEIQQDLAGVVQSSEGMVNQLVTMAEEAYHHVSLGLWELNATTQEQQQMWLIQQRQDRHRTTIAVVVVVLLMMIVFGRAYATS